VKVRPSSRRRGNINASRAARAPYTLTPNLAKRDKECEAGVFAALGMRTATSEHDAVRPSQGGIRADVNVRHELRVRYRIPARQHGGVRSRRRRAALRPLVRDRQEVGSILVDETRKPASSSRASPRPRADLLRLRAHCTSTSRERSAPGERRGAAEAAGARIRVRESTDGSRHWSGVAKSRGRARGIRDPLRPAELAVVNHLVQSLKEQSCTWPYVEDVIQDGEVRSLDEFTGRIMEAAVERGHATRPSRAKENVRSRKKHQGRWRRPAPELLPPGYENARRHDRHREPRRRSSSEIYNLKVVEIPTKVDVARFDDQERLQGRRKAVPAVIHEIKERHAKRAAVSSARSPSRRPSIAQNTATRRGRAAQRTEWKEHAARREIIKEDGRDGGAR